MQIKEREANAAQALFLDKGMPAHLLIEFAERGESLVQGLVAWPDDDWTFTTIGQELYNRGLPQIGAVFGNHLPSSASAPLRPSQAPMWGAGSCGGGHINAPIMNSNGPRWSQCAKCRKVFGLSHRFAEGSHLVCAGCGQNLLLKNMTDAEFVELLKQYPQKADENIGIVKLYNFGPRVKFGDFTESLSLHHQFVGRVKRRDSSEADAAQDLIMSHGVNPSVIMRAANNKCVFARARVQDGKLFIPVDRPVSLTSTLAIQMLLHFYAVRERYIPAPVSTWPPAQRAIVESFMLKGLIREQDHEDYVTTDKGALIVATLKAVMTESLSHV